MQTTTDDAIEEVVEKIYQFPLDKCTTCMLKSV